ncbi:MAG TPA: class I SAM-dependent methyltransferase [Kofleriaceae bacterium]|jgi:SAM-dependent methyltransferase|nr:class I SAM-dependent methyltransferase [Kofleriaceae bacterium]
MTVQPSWTPKLVLDPVLQDEANFANQDYAPYADNLAINPEMFRRYHAPRDLWDWRQLAALLLGELAGKDLLDMACGMGEESVYFAKLGARVTGIDISDVGVASLRKRAAFHRLDITALEMRCDPTSFPDASFDRIHGLGILHHVGIEAGLREVDRLLRPGGLGVFLEPLGDSQAVEAAKMFLMKHARFLGNFDHVTDHEHNLTWREIHAATARFADVRLFPYHLLYRLKRFFPQSWLKPIRRLDAGFLTLAPQLQHFAGGVVIAVRARNQRGS